MQMQLEAGRQHCILVLRIVLSSRGVSFIWNPDMWMWARTFAHAILSLLSAKRLYLQLCNELRSLHGTVSSMDSKADARCLATASCVDASPASPGLLAREQPKAPGFSCCAFCTCRACRGSAALAESWPSHIFVVARCMCEARASMVVW